jgi:hypothetical protein
MRASLISRLLINNPFPLLLKHLCDALVLPLPKLLRAIACLVMHLRLSTVMLLTKGTVFSICRLLSKVSFHTKLKIFVTKTVTDCMTPWGWIYDDM